MGSAERRFCIDGGVPKWVEALEIKVPPAPVVIRSYISSRASGENIWEQIRNPRPLNVCWMTIEIPMPEEFERDYFGVSIIDSKGEPSDLAAAVPLDFKVRDPFIFLWSGSEEQRVVEPIDGDIKVETLGFWRDAFVYKLGHEFLSSTKPQEWYFLFHAQGQFPLQCVQELVEPNRLISGSAHGTVGKRLSTFISQDLPFEYLLELDKPGLHQLGKMGTRILGK